MFEIMPELITMTRAMLMAFRATASALLMVLLLVYVFSVMMSMLLRDEHELNATLSRDFSSMGHSMFTLVVDGTLMEEPGNVLTEMMMHGSVRGITGMFVFGVFVMISSLLVMNMLIGVLCEVVSTVTTSEKDEAAVRLVKDTILVELLKFDDGDGLISHEEIDQVIQDPHSNAVLNSLDIDRLFLTELQSTLFQDEGDRIPIKGVIELMLLCRADLPSTVKHVASGQAFLHGVISKLDKHLTKHMRHVQDSLHRLAKHMERQVAAAPAPAKAGGQPLIEVVGGPQHPGLPGTNAALGPRRPDLQEEAAAARHAPGRRHSL
jgi:hypothetical protein